MKKLVMWGLVALSLASGQALAQRLNSHETLDVKAPIQDVWDAVKDFDGLHKWHPMFSDAHLKSGANDEVGTIRTLTVKDGPSFDEELLSFNEIDRKFSYKVIDPNPLPIAAYVSTFEVIEGRRGHTTIVWRSSFVNNSEGKMKDDELIAFINGAYRAGLDNLKTMLENKY
jgi:Polyketide cyclase / dehydrase and lipid transport